MSTLNQRVRFRGGLRCGSVNRTMIGPVVDDDYSESESSERIMRCLSCKEDYTWPDAGTCKECYDEASETEEELRREIADLKSRIAFLSFLDHDRPPNARSVPRSCPGNNCSGGGYGVPAFPDVVLLGSEDDADYVPVPAHRAVLASRSPVFKAMLENEMEESRSRTIKITDASTEVLKAFVGYLYTAEALLDEQMACELLVLAEKYQVEHLKAYCEKFLVSTLNWDNSVVNYSFAHQHNAKLLLDASLCLITDNMDKLTNQAEYRQLVEKDARLVVGIYEFYLSKQMTGGKQDFVSQMVCAGSIQSDPRTYSTSTHAPPPLFPTQFEESPTPLFPTQFEESPRQENYY
ncbi:hypothetical protein MLD38_013056 [Melastoma candidum]|uniref:Uncharacterized protein n=1 Tax=Melastoma candidum TaxID=119954 RepID=A0ACB9R9L3_9MYRT|nr:hypothetical protein MLD38_013056 [Melastoma candidum]